MDDTEAKTNESNFDTEDTNPPVDIAANASHEAETGQGVDGEEGSDNMIENEDATSMEFDHGSGQDAEQQETVSKDEDNMNVDEKPEDSAPKDEKIEVAEEPKTPKEKKRIRRRRLKRIIKKCKGRISFTRLLNVDLDLSDDEQYFDKSYYEEENLMKDEDTLLPKRRGRPPKHRRRVRQRIRINLDAALKGGKKRQGTYTGVISIGQPLQYEPSDPSAIGQPLTPAEEGWYEGIASMALPEDSIYLKTRPVQQWTRENLEFFSATEADASMAQGGRRTQTVRGRVGIRCIHCAAAAKAAMDAADEPLDRLSLWPAGSVSYPLSTESIYTACSQKATLHFADKCPNLPQEERERLLYLMQVTVPTLRGPDAPRISTALYYALSARRMGLVDVKDGIRFGRDLSLEPLPFETIKAQMEAEQQYSLTPVAAAVASASLVRDIPPSAASTSENVLTPAAVSSGYETRATADEESEAVLAEVVAEDDKPEVYIGRNRDKSFVSDYMFLVIRQMRFCNAVTLDFTSRGKKPKTMRIGTAGFCCRWCQEAAQNVLLNSPLKDEVEDAENRLVAVTDTSCRSFPSAADNLSSSISNSFSNHLQKCDFTPLKIKKAVTAYKKIHSSQISQLPYGSQRRLIHDIWDRLRALDKSEEEMRIYVPKRLNGAMIEAEAPIEVEKQVVPPEAEEESDPRSHPAFPVCKDPETQAVVQDAEESWDLDTNDNLIQPSDRSLVSDYVFLAMRQLKIIHPEAFDASRPNQPPTADIGQLPGIACMHCLNQEQSSSVSTGRAFVSKPDNFAPALNTSMYRHFLACEFVSEDLKRALVNTRKIHSAQCSKLKFGSQRRFFKLLVGRLEDARGEPTQTVKDDKEPEAGTGDAESTMNKLAEFGFIKIPSSTEAESFLFCKHCRMVPVHFRARYSVLFGEENPIGRAREHSSQCQGNCLHLEVITDAMEKVIHSCHNGDVKVMDNENFKNLVAVAVGGNDVLTTILTGQLRSLVSNRIDADDNAVEDSLDMRAEVKDLLGCIPPESNYSEVENAFFEFAEGYPDLPTDLKESSAWLDFLMLICPFLTIPSSTGPMEVENAEEVEDDLEEGEENGNDNEQADENDDEIEEIDGNGNENEQADDDDDEHEQAEENENDNEGDDDGDDIEDEEDIEDKVEDEEDIADDIEDKDESEGDV